MPILMVFFAFFGDQAKLLMKLNVLLIMMIYNGYYVVKNKS